MKILVTGGAGAIGSNLANQLAADGNDVVALDNLSSGRKSNLHGNTLVEGDICDPEILNVVFRERFDEIYHLAAFFANQNSCDHPIADMRTNIEGTIRLLMAAAEKPPRRFLYASTSSISSELSSGSGFSTPYMTSKYAGELYVRHYSKRFGLPIRIVRYFNGYGPNEYPGKYRNVIINFIAKALDNKPLPITGDGTETRDFTFVEDLVRGTISVARADCNLDGPFDIGTGVETPILEIAKIINDLTENTSGVEFRPRRDWDRTSRRLADLSAIQTISDYSPSVDLRDGIATTLEWYRNVQNEDH